MADDICIVMTTVETPEQAKTLARAVIDARLAACAQIVPVSSCYRWEGKVVEEGEQMMLFKTRADQFAVLEALLLELHPYDTPEIIRLPVEGVGEKYRAWVFAETGD